MTLFWVLGFCFLGGLNVIELDYVSKSSVCPELAQVWKLFWFLYLAWVGFFSGEFSLGSCSRVAASWPGSGILLVWSTADRVRAGRRVALCNAAQCAAVQSFCLPQRAAWFQRHCRGGVGSSSGISQWLAPSFLFKTLLYSSFARLNSVCRLL